MDEHTVASQLEQWRTNTNPVVADLPLNKPLPGTATRLSKVGVRASIVAPSDFRMYKTNDLIGDERDHLCAPFRDGIEPTPLPRRNQFCKIAVTEITTSNPRNEQHKSATATASTSRKLRSVVSASADSPLGGVL
jgi:hypothetical protein